MNWSLLGCANFLWQKTCHVGVWAANIVKNSEVAIKISRFFLCIQILTIFAG
jgi:hypothetical protein